MKNILLTTVVVALLSACQSDKTSEETSVEAGTHKVLVEEVIQTNQYTYLHVKEGDSEAWLAAPKMDATIGQTFYFKGGLPMSEFSSKELNRTFKEILFLDNISTSSVIPEKSNSQPSIQVSSIIPDSNPENTVEQSSEDDHNVIAKEVLQTSQYTYILGKEGKNEIWLAAKKMEASVGETYYFKGGLPMTNFESKELKRTFNDILFLDNISSSKPKTEKNNSASSQSNLPASAGSAISLEKKEIKMKHAKEDITIAMLLGNKKKYSGRTIKIQGEVTKFSPAIMKKNWIHIQDGTDFSGKFDLTATSDQDVNIGDRVTLEGTIVLDKDFGYGYFYDLIMEDAKLVK